MKVIISSDHRGFEMKEALKKQGYDIPGGVEWIDLGPKTLDPMDDYVDYAIEAIDYMQGHPEIERAVLLCSTAIGMSIVANKFIGIRAGLAINVEHIKLARKDDDINVLALAASFFNVVHARLMVEEFLKTPYSNLPRYQRRIDKINELEHSDIPEV